MEKKKQVSDSDSGERMPSKPPIRSVQDLEVYRLAFSLAMDVFNLTKSFPKEETYSLTDQIRRASRSVAINIREGFARRKYHLIFIKQLNDASGSSEETRGWLDFSLECGYINPQTHQKLDHGYDRINAMLFNLANNWKTFDK